MGVGVRAMAAALRVAFLADSWMAEWEHEPIAADWRLVPTPIAVEASAVLSQCLACAVERTVVAFPGCSAKNMLRLAELCSIHDMATWSQSGESLKNAIDHFSKEVDLVVVEEVDLVVVMLGANDLEQQHHPSSLSSAVRPL